MGMQVLKPHSPQSSCSFYLFQHKDKQGLGIQSHILAKCQMALQIFDFSLCEASKDSDTHSLLPPYHIYMGLHHAYNIQWPRRSLEIAHLFSHLIVLRDIAH